MVKSIFAVQGISYTLKNLRQLISSFPKTAGSVAVVSQKRINHQWSIWSSELPSVHPFYAVKSNPEPTLLQTLVNRGASFDCASIREIHDVTKMYWNNDEKRPDIIYAHPMKSTKDIHLVKDSGIDVTVVDSVEECDKLRACDWKGSAFLRVAVDDTGSKMPFSSKFGATREEVELISRHSKIPISGVSFHVGSGCQDPTQYERAIDYSAGHVFDVLRKYGHNPKVIDIGGGFSANLQEFRPAAASIRKALEKVPKNRKVIAEPGRFFAQPSHDLFVKVIAKKPGKDRSWRYIIDESLYGYFSSIVFDHQRPPWFRVLVNEHEKERRKSDAILFGRTCDSLDVIARGKMEELEVGDWLYFPMMGAYTSATASEFNGFPKPYLLNDSENVLPQTNDCWEWMREFHKAATNITYSNALPPIV